MQQPPTPNLVLPLDVVAESQPFSQSQPLCTPLDRPIIQMFASSQPPSPVRKPHGRFYHQQAGPSSVASLSQSQYPHDARQNQNAFILPDMSQDTLALFPVLVKEHVAQAQLGLPQSASGFGVTNRPPKHPASASTLGLAKASMLATLHMHPPIRNPYVPPAFGGETGTNVAKKFASESFDAESIGNVDEPGTGIKCQELASLKTSIVAATQPQSSLLHFTQVSPPKHTSFSTITKATSRIDGVCYALKRNLVPFSSNSEKMSALQEVLALAALQSVPNVLRYHTSWWESGGKHLVIQCEWVETGCVSGKLPLSEVCKLGLSLATVLACMHDRGMVHLDVKPDNIFVGQRDGESAYILADYGLSRRVDPTGAALMGTAGAGYADGRSLDGDSRYLCPEGLDTVSSKNAETPSASAALRVYSRETSSRSPLHERQTSDDEADSALNSSLKSPFSPAVPPTARPLKRRRWSRLTIPNDSDDESFNCDASPLLALSARQTGFHSETSSEDIADKGNTKSVRDHRHQMSPVIPSVSFMDTLDIEAPDYTRKRKETANYMNYGLRHGPRPDMTDLIDCSNVNIHDNRDDDDENDFGNSPVVRMQKEGGNHLFTEEGAARHCQQVTTTPRDLRAADIFSLGATLFELSTGESLPASGPRWHWLREEADEVFHSVLESTNSRKFAQIVRECLTSQPFARPSAASLIAKLGSIDSHQSALAGARARIRALQAHNAALRNALGQLVDPENSKRRRVKNEKNRSVEASITRGQSFRRATTRPRGNVSVPRDKRVSRKPSAREHRLLSRSPVIGIPGHPDNYC